MYVVCLLFYAIGECWLIFLSVKIGRYIIYIFYVSERDDVLFLSYLPMTAFVRSDTTDDAFCLHLTQYFFDSGVTYLQPFF